MALDGYATMGQEDAWRALSLIIHALSTKLDFADSMTCFSQNLIQKNRLPTMRWYSVT